MLGSLQGRAGSSSLAWSSASLWLTAAGFHFLFFYAFYNPGHVTVLQHVFKVRHKRVYILTETEISSGLALSLKTRMFFITLALSLCI